MASFGYARVSTDGQSVDAQVRQLRDAGAKKIFPEAASGAKTARREFGASLTRPKPDPYDLQWVKPRALVDRRHCLGIAERIGPEGQVLQPLTEEELAGMGDRVAGWLAEADSTGRLATVFDTHAVAVNLLFSYANAA